ncbi:Endoplasmic reticulum oxidoreductin-1 [Zalerion maritima]|uniref:Endoplasmic reticulum oxidoreductin-1 n=1 Tax=Zalerion maritima TaxID=339359 RepID=A0AAD5RH91_9PEZI|nr:Endoplasmic reticulum oxidoreductin-1 [Zalerion maritima]
MKPAAKHFFLTVFALWGAPGNCGVQDEDCPISPRAIVSDACASYSTLEQLNERVKPAVDDLTRNTDFFSHYRVNLFHQRCPFWNDENSMCGNIGCAVQTLDNEEDIPEVWRAHELGKLEGPHAKHPGRKVQKEHPNRPLDGKLGDDVGESCVVEYDDECDERDYCVPEDESATSKGDYVSLITNPERFTGYSGDGATGVWDAIYRENCFQKSLPLSPVGDDGSSTPAGGFSFADNPAAAAFDLKSVLDAAGRQQVLQLQRQNNPNTPFVAQTGFEVDDECLEKRVFYKVMSGMHASISTHLCWDFLNQTTGEWTPNLRCYEFRLHKHPDRISNLYFNYALLTRAIAKLKPQLQDQEDGGEYVFCTGDMAQDADTRAKVLAVTEAAESVPQIFDESLMFANGEGPSLKEDFRHRFRNVSRLMDCVGCDKCRLWGKLQTAGYGAALKVLFESEEDETARAPHLKRTELVALFNTYSRLASSLSAIGKFRAMIEEEQAEMKAEAIESGEEQVEEKKETWDIPDRVKKPHNVVFESSGGNEAEESPAAAGFEDDEDDDDLDDGHCVDGGDHKPTFKETFYKELDNVGKVTKFVLKSWIDIPKNLYRIAMSELVRGWQYYAGRRVNQRIWSWDHGVEIDEL